MSRTHFSKKSLAIIIAVAMVFSAIPLFGGSLVGISDKAYAAAGEGSSIVFNYEVNGKITGTVTTSFAALTKNTDMTSYKYLAWDGSKYKVYGVTSTAAAISIDARSGTPAGNTLVSQIGALMGKTIVGNYGTVRFKMADGKVKEYSANDMMRRAQFPKNTGSTAFAASPTYSNEQNGVQAFITLSAKSDAVTTTSSAVTPSTAVAGLTLCTNLDTRYGDYGYASMEERYKKVGDMPQNIVEITFSNNTAFNVYQQIGDGTRRIVKGYSDDALTNLANTNRIGFLQAAGSTWTVHGTDKYVPIRKLVEDAGLVFNKGDALLIRSNDMFSYRPTYETIQSEKYFFGGITSSDVDIANQTEVGAVIAIGNYGATDITAGTASLTLKNMTIPTPSSISVNKRFLIGLSAANATNKVAAGSRFPNYVLEVTVIKDKADIIVGSAVAGVAASYKKTGSSIKPIVTVILDGVALVKDRDYTVTYGANKEISGTVTIAGKGSVTGTVVRTFKIDDGTTAKVFKATVPAKGKFKAAAGKKQATISWGKIAAANQGYQIQYAVKKNFTGKKTVKASASVVKKTIKGLKKGKTYYFKVRGVAKIDGKTVYTKWSVIRKVNIK